MVVTSSKLISAQEEERRTIARELHDEVGQVLTAIKVELAVAQRAIEAAGGQTAVLSDARAIADSALQTVRDLSHLLHPPLLDEAGFASAASWFVAGFSQRSGIPVALDLPADLQRLPEAIEIALFRILQESLTNVHRHSRTKSAEISVDVDAEQVTIEVRDHGRGMPPHVIRQIEAETSKLGVGLAGMRERIHELGGRFAVSSDEQGTTV